MLATILYLPVGLFWLFNTARTFLTGEPYISILAFPIIPDLLNAANIFFVIAGAAIFFELIVYNSLLTKVKRHIRTDFIKKPKIVVGMTAYNDEKSISLAVKDFLSHPLVREVIVVDNNSKDNTSVAARKAGATTVVERRQGYGYCCRRALHEVASRKPDVMCLVEGDMTFTSKDLDKLLVYIGHVDMVVGTRTTEELQESGSQMSMFINIGNMYISKLIQLRFWGYTRLTDVGCTYRIIRTDAYEKIRRRLTVGTNHFSPHMIIEALKAKLSVIEVPITMRKRVGVSKGVGSKRWRGFLVGLRMWWIILKS